ncbi:NADH dehydrogenase [ubiquinone] 1 subunit C2 [Sitophilus oryzae]|uniref:NADH dehydrogenase [ubiquinone] 1 subunit C2 n=1 Tax=Sitophilus oryzae TaxID=7048 RepID=A0A6J2XII3_SITOR|nr:NADH dehydrogenase [ubiquinone] 1 subunit C2 [Sitophilus oryzae]
MAGTGPQVALSPLELLNKRPTTERPLISQYLHPAVAAIVSLIGMAVANKFSPRPVLSGIHRYAFAGVGGFFVGKVLDDWRESYLAERDAILRHYVELHPEDFPPFERKKFKDVLEPWTPIR